MFPIPWNFPFKKKDGSTTTIDDAISAGGGGGYTLPTASGSTKGGIKIGSGLTMDGEVLNNNNPTAYTLPMASADVLGGVKVGSGLSIAGGVLSNPNAKPAVYEPTLESGITGSIKFVKDANGFIMVSGHVTLEAPLTATRLKLASNIDTDYLAGNDGYQTVVIRSEGATMDGYPSKNCETVLFGSGNLWLYKGDNPNTLQDFIIHDIYTTDTHFTPVIE